MGNYRIISYFFFAIGLGISPYLHAKNVLTACASPSWVPSTWETDNSIEGLFVDVLNDFASQAGYEIQYQKMNAWARCLRQAERGDIDIVLGAYKTTERQVWGEYSDAINHDLTRVFAVEERLSIRGIKDLVPYRGGIRIGDSYGAQMDDFIIRQGKVPNAIVRLNSEENIIKMLASYRLDYFPGVEGNVYSQIAKLKQQGALDKGTKIVAIGPVFSTNSLHFVVSKRRADAKKLISRINHFYQVNYSEKRLKKLISDKHQAYMNYIAKDGVKGK